ncbi:uncharacterized protein LOC143445344 [Clavelina lepadiformis]|uniref:uncharacterized protein LOC143445344 n=1 Tax=Clavelina lepadiformis TaxID=159417 RepID=UPI004042DC06
MSQESDDETRPLLKQKTETTKAKQKEILSSSEASHNKPTHSVHGRQPSAEIKPMTSSRKVKKSTFLQREIDVKNYQNVDHNMALEAMSEMFEEEYVRWKRRTGVFKLANLIVTLLVIAVQLVQTTIPRVHWRPFCQRLLEQFKQFN